MYSHYSPSTPQQLQQQNQQHSNEPHGVESSNANYQPPGSVISPHIHASPGGHGTDLLNNNNMAGHDVMADSIGRNDMSSLSVLAGEPPQPLSLFCSRQSSGGPLSDCGPPSSISTGGIPNPLMSSPSGGQPSSSSATSCNQLISPHSVGPMSGSGGLMSPSGGIAPNLALQPHSLDLGGGGFFNGPNGNGGGGGILTNDFGSSLEAALNLNLPVPMDGLNLPIPDEVAAAAAAANVGLLMPRRLHGTMTIDDHLRSIPTPPAFYDQHHHQQQHHHLFGGGGGGEPMDQRHQEQQLHQNQQHPSQDRRASTSSSSSTPINSSVAAAASMLGIGIPGMSAGSAPHFGTAPGVGGVVGGVGVGGVGGLGLSVGMDSLCKSIDHNISFHEQMASCGINLPSSSGSSASSTPPVEAAHNQHNSHHHLQLQHDMGPMSNIAGIVDQMLSNASMHGMNLCLPSTSSMQNVEMKPEPMDHEEYLNAFSRNPMPIHSIYGGRMSDSVLSVGSGARGSAVAAAAAANDDICATMASMLDASCGGLSSSAAGIGGGLSSTSALSAGGGRSTAAAGTQPSPATTTASGGGGGTISSSRRTRSSNDAMFKCHYCPKKWADEEALRTHMIDCQVLRSHQCPVCQKRFKARGGLQQHLRIHSNDRPYHCHFCPKKFTQKSHVDQHERIHTGIKPFNCSICGRAFRQRSQQMGHEATHANGTFHGNHHHSHNNANNANNNNNNQQQSSAGGLENALGSQPTPNISNLAELNLMDARNDYRGGNQLNLGSLQSTSGMSSAMIPSSPMPDLSGLPDAASLSLLGALSQNVAGGPTVTSILALSQHQPNHPQMGGLAGIGGPLGLQQHPDQHQAQHQAQQQQQQHLMDHHLAGDMALDQFASPNMRMQQAVGLLNSLH